MLRTAVLSWLLLTGLLGTVLLVLVVASRVAAVVERVRESLTVRSPAGVNGR